jgi:hypothetical protein
MNWKHHITVPVFAHDLICTTCPPKTDREQRVNNSDSPVKSRLPAISLRELFTAKIAGITGGEQVSAGIFYFFGKKFIPDDSPRRQCR